MKSILLSIRPKWVAKILNGEKTIEVRKKFPKDYVGWVYIYCTKDQNEELWWYDGTEDFRLYKKGIANEKDIGWHLQNGKIVARFWCDNVEEILHKPNGNFYTNFLSNRKLLTQSCLTQNEISDYTAGNWHQKFSYWYGGYAIHISKLEIFDKPKELSEFRLHYGYKECKSKNCSYDGGCWLCELTNPPQNFCYVED